MKVGKFLLIKPFLWPVERFLCNTILSLATFDLIMIIVRNIGFDWFSYSLFFALGIFMITVGLFYRSSGRSERISMTLWPLGYSFCLQLCYQFSDIYCSRFGENPLIHFWSRSMLGLDIHGPTLFNLLVNIPYLMN